MATVDITEYQNLATDERGNRIATGMEPARVVQQLPVSPVSAKSGKLDDVTRFVRVHTDSTIRIAFGSEPVASGASQRMIGNSTEFFGVVPGMKIAVIASN